MYVFAAVDRRLYQPPRHAQETQLNSWATLCTPLPSVLYTILSTQTKKQRGNYAWLSGAEGATGYYHLVATWTPWPAVVSRGSVNPRWIDKLLSLHTPGCPGQPSKEFPVCILLLLICDHSLRRNNNPKRSQKNRKQWETHLQVTWLAKCSGCARQNRWWGPTTRTNRAE